jgi:FAD/FMN-containing dehydrogenase
MKGVYVDPEAQTVMVQGGAQWVDVDTETSKFGLACVGGTFSDVGVGGVSVKSIVLALGAHTDAH